MKTSDIKKLGTGITVNALPKTIKFPRSKDALDKLIKKFLTGSTEGVFEKYAIHGDKLVYKTLVYGELKANLIAIRIGNEYIGNSSILPLINRRVSFGNETLNRREAEIQQRLSRLIQMIPFTVFQQAGLDITKFKLIDRGLEETVSVKEEKYNSKTRENETIFVSRHFTGSSLFEVENRIFLFDIDRREIDHGIFNAFLVELPTRVKTIKEAYQSLKPTEVLEAEKQGLKVLRQGEWFLIPVNDKLKPTMRKNINGDLVPIAGTLQAGNNRPNNTELFHEPTGYVKGLITHRGREHEPLLLTVWHKPVPNTATRSFTITGDID